MNLHKINNTLGCPNCEKLYNNISIKRVKIKGCGHKCCQNCLKEFQQNGNFICIYKNCNGKSSRQSSICSAQSNRRRSSLQKENKNPLFCTKHPSEISNLYCFDCEQNMCFKCSQQQIHNSHQLMNEQNIESKGQEIYQEIQKVQSKLQYEYNDFFQDYISLMVKPKINSYKFSLSKNLEKKKNQLLEIFENNRKSVIKQFDLLQKQFIDNIEQRRDSEKLKQKYNHLLQSYDQLKEINDQKNILLHKKLLKNNMGQQLCDQFQELIYKFKDSENLYDQKAQKFVDNLKLKFNFRKNDSLLILQNKNVLESLENSVKEQINLNDSRNLSGFQFIAVNNKQNHHQSPKYSKKKNFAFQSDSDEYSGNCKLNQTSMNRSNHYTFNIPKQNSVKNLNQLLRNSTTKDLIEKKKISYNPLYKSQLQFQKPRILLNNNLIQKKQQPKQQRLFQRRKFDLKNNKHQQGMLKRNHHSLPNLLKKSQKLQKKPEFEKMKFEEALNAIEQGNQVINLKNNLKESQLLKFSEILKETRELQYLNIASNNIEDRYFQLFCKKLPHIKIKHLDISKNQIFFDGLLKLNQYCQTKLRIYKITAKKLKLSDLQQKKITKEFQRIKTLICFD